MTTDSKMWKMKWLIVKVSNLYKACLVLLSELPAFGNPSK